MDLKIKDASAGDERCIVELICELAETMDFPSGVTEESVRRFLAFPGCGVLLAFDEDGAVGLLSYSIRPGLFHGGDSALIEELVVKREARGQGIGGALMKEFLRRVKRMGCIEVSVTTMPHNKEAIRFYKSYGLVEEALFLEKHLINSFEKRCI